MSGSIAILTGAGISAESGLGTFRDEDGVWTKYPLEKLATPEGFQEDPNFVYGFYNMRREKMRAAKPNAAHIALAKLEAEHAQSVTIITQNIDPLHERAGSKNVIHMHGESLRYWCTGCDSKRPWDKPFDHTTICEVCGEAGYLRPDVVWFGEIPYHMEEIKAVISDCDMFVSIGTSGNVYPAAGFVQLAKQAQAQTLELNLEPSEGALCFDKGIYGIASEIVPDWVENLLDCHRS